MKKVLLFVFIIINMINLYSQDIIDPQRLFDKTNQTWQVYPNIYLNLPSCIINENKFKLGWNWGSPSEKFDDALKIKYYHGEYNAFQSSLSTPNFNYISQVKDFSAGHMHYGKLNSMAIQFDPAITVDTTINYEPPSWDATGAIYGFFDKNYGTVDINISSNTFHRFLLDKTGVTQDIKVLSNSWPQKKAFFLLDYSNISNDLLQEQDVFTYTNEQNQTITRNDFPLNGTRWYLSINLKSLENISTPVTEETVLKIKLKYTMNDNQTVGYINFDKIPKQGNSSITNIVSTLSNNRGKSRQDSVLSSPIDYFPITTKMLRTNTTGTNHTDITLSAHFYARDKFDQDIPPSTLPKLSVSTSNSRFAPFLISS